MQNIISIFSRNTLLIFLLVATVGDNVGSRRRMATMRKARPTTRMEIVRCFLGTFHILLLVYSISGVKYIPGKRSCENLQIKMIELSLLSERGDSKEVLSTVKEG